ncbi:hypothetical protein PM082_013120 [Marasmius tenuissimus]|nr:hypothetical protein PM082_013120 [Marasmius tenuissimus]
MPLLPVVLSGNPGRGLISVPDASPPQTRSVYGIVWSCIATIFACTWVSMHPNVPSPKDSYWRFISRRAMMMALGILAPEYTTVWALRQWLGARYVARQMAARNDAPQWTLTHSFFLIMGGFMLVDEQGKPISNLRLREMIHLKEEGRIDFPSITEKEIEDKSKGDALSKTLVLVQTTWFLLQVLARAVLHLPVTELEVVTIAFASLHILAFCFWYKKPLNVECPVQVPLRCRLRTGSPLLSGPLGRSSFITDDHVSSSDVETVDITEAHHEVVVRVQVNNDRSFEADDEQNPPSIPAFVVSDEKNVEGSHTQSIRPFLFLRSLSAITTTIQLGTRTVEAVQRQIMPEILNPGLTQGGHPSHSDETYYDTTCFRDTVFVADFRDDASLRVPTFHCGGRGGMATAIPGAIQMAIAIYFGGIHCIAWNFSFPSVAEKWLWRVSAVVLMAVPLYFLLLIIVIRDIFRKLRQGRANKLTRPVSLVLTLAGSVVLRYPRFFSLTKPFFLYLYLIFRIVLVVLPFVLLRDLPTDALAEVEWTSFIPHL